MTRSLRILHVSEAFGGGIVGVVAPLAERLTRAGHSVAVAYGVRPETPADVRNELSDDVEVFPLPWQRRTMREQVKAAKALRRLAAEWEPDVVHLHSSFAGVVGSMALARRYVLVYSPHGYSFTRTTDAPLRRLAYRAAERYVARRVDVVAAVSESEAAQARAGVRAPAVEVVPNGIPELDPGALPTVPSRPVARVVGMGRADHQRQPDAAGRILASVADVFARGVRVAPEAPALSEKIEYPLPAERAVEPIPDDRLEIAPGDSITSRRRQRSRPARF